MPPKKKHSKRRQRNKNANAAIKAPSIVQCKQCYAYIQGHRACPECGYYNGRQVTSVESDE